MAIRIGIRELRQHASRYIRRVRAGETIIVTDRGEPVAEIRPTRPPSTHLERLVAEGRLTPPRGDIQKFLREHPPRPALRGIPTLTEVLLEQRSEER